MADVIDVMYRLRNMAGEAADPLRAAIKEAQAVLDKLDLFADEAESAVELVAASDLYPTHCANIPPASGLVRAPEPGSEPTA